MFEKSFVTDTKERKDLNIPKMSGEDGKLLRGLNEERVEMYRCVDAERNRALAAELEEKRRAEREETWLNELIEGYNHWKVLFSIGLTGASDGLYLYSIDVVYKDYSSVSGGGTSTVVFPIKRDWTGISVAATTVGDRFVILASNSKSVMLMVPDCEFSEKEFELTNPVIIQDPWAHADEIEARLSSRISALESRVSSLERT